MKSHEFLTEKTIAVHDFDDIRVYVDDHIFDQHVKRPNEVVSLYAIGTALGKILKVRNEISELEAGQEFWIYYDKLRVGLGMRKIDVAGKKYQLKTVINDEPHREGRNPVIDIPLQ